MGSSLNALEILVGREVEPTRGIVQAPLAQLPRYQRRALLAKLGEPAMRIWYTQRPRSAIEASCWASVAAGHARSGPRFAKAKTALVPAPRLSRHDMRVAKTERVR